MPLPLILSLSGPVLTDDEAALFHSAQPFGIILFGRNIENPDQLRTLTAALRDCVGRDDMSVLIDQEGGRVQRLKPPHWQRYKAMQECCDPAFLETEITRIAADLRDVDIDVNCAPVLDVLQPDTDTSIGDRAFSHDPDEVARLGALACSVFLDNGIVPVIKHLPGHGRATLDSHLALPKVTASLDDLRKVDFKPFVEVMKQPFAAELWGMVGHCLYTELDHDLPASLSPRIIQDVIRDEIGFTGLLMSDDLSMGALSSYGNVAERAVLCLEAGCDIALYCAGKLDEMNLILEEFE